MDSMTVDTTLTAAPGEAALALRPPLLRPRARSPRASLLPTISLVRVLDEDPDLGADVAPEEWELAARHAVAPSHLIERGPWQYAPDPCPGSLGAIILQGLVIVRVSVGARAHVELLGEGDVISPWVGLGPDATVPSITSARVVSPVRVALLDRGFALRTARWPEIHATLVQRLIQRARRLSLQSAINALSRTEERLELTFWTLASRFGRVTPAGYTLHLRLSHAQLAEMVAASRPSVSHALSGLRQAGRIICTERHSWLLCGPPPAKLAPIAQQIGQRP